MQLPGRRGRLSSLPTSSPCSTPPSLLAPGRDFGGGLTPSYSAVPIRAISDGPAPLRLTNTADILLSLPFPPHFHHPPAPLYLCSSSLRVRLLSLGGGKTPWTAERERRGRATREGEGVSLSLLSRPDASFLALLAVLPDCLAALAKARSGGGVWNNHPWLSPPFLYCSLVNRFLLKLKLPLLCTVSPSPEESFICGFLSTMRLLRMLWTASPTGDCSLRIRAADHMPAHRVTCTEMLYVCT